MLKKVQNDETFWLLATAKVGNVFEIAKNISSYSQGKRI